MLVIWMKCRVCVQVTSLMAVEPQLSPLEEDTLSPIPLSHVDTPGISERTRRFLGKPPPEGLFGGSALSPFASRHSVNTGGARLFFQVSKSSAKHYEGLQHLRLAMPDESSAAP